jgi:site-specific DNA-cytosine methylase
LEEIARDNLSEAQKMNRTLEQQLSTMRGGVATSRITNKTMEAVNGVISDFQSAIGEVFKTEQFREGSNEILPVIRNVYESFNAAFKDNKIDRSESDLLMDYLKKSDDKLREIFGPTFKAFEKLKVVLEKSPEKFKFPLGLDNNNKIIFDEIKLASNAKAVRVGDILLPDVEKKYTISDKLFSGHKRRLIEHKAKGNGFGFSLFDENSPYTSTISARYYKDGSEILIAQKGANPRKLSPKEAGLLQGYPMKKEFKLVVSDVQAYKQFGNSVSVPVVKTLAKEIIKQLL